MVPLVLLVVQVHLDLEVVLLAEERGARGVQPDLQEVLVPRVLGVPEVSVEREARLENQDHQVLLAVQDPEAHQGLLDHLVLLVLLAHQDHKAQEDHEDNKANGDPLVREKTFK